MESKFHHLAIGQHFEWEGKSYIKSTPLIATQVPEGGQKFMPRAAIVKVLGIEAQEPVSEAPATLDSAIVRAALDRYHQRCMHISEACVGSEENTLSCIEKELEQIYRELLLELKL